MKRDISDVFSVLKTLNILKTKSGGGAGVEVVGSKCRFRFEGQAKAMMKNSVSSCLL